MFIRVEPSRRVPTPWGHLCITSQTIPSQTLQACLSDRSGIRQSLQKTTQPVTSPLKYKAKVFPNDFHALGDILLFNVDRKRVDTSKEDLQSKADENNKKKNKVQGNKKNWV